MEQELKEIKSILANTLTLTEENNQMLKAMRRAQKLATFMRVVYWLIVIGIAIGAFYFLQPFIDQTESMIKGFSSTAENFKNVFPVLE